MPLLTRLESKTHPNIQDVALRDHESTQAVTLRDVVTPEIMNSIADSLETNKVDIEFCLDMLFSLLLVCQITGYKRDFYAPTFNAVKEYVEVYFHTAMGNHENSLAQLVRIRQIYGKRVGLIHTTVFGPLLTFGENVRDRFMYGAWNENDLKNIVNAFIAFPSYFSSLSPENEEKLIDIVSKAEKPKNIEYLAYFRLLKPALQVDSTQLIAYLREIKTDRFFQTHPEWAAYAFYYSSLLSAETVAITEDGLLLTPAPTPRPPTQSSENPPAWRIF